MSISRIALVAGLCMLGACSQLPAHPAQPAPKPMSDLDALAARIGIAGTADYDSARAALSRATVGWNGGADGQLQGQARELMKQATTLDAMIRQRIPAAEWDALIARARALAESTPPR